MSNLCQGHWSQLLCFQGLFQAQNQLLGSSMPFPWVTKELNTWSTSTTHGGWHTNSHQAEPPVQLPTNQPTLTKYSYQTSCHLPLPSPCSTPPSASQPRIGPPSGRSGRNWLVTFIIESLYLCQPWCCAAVLLNSQNLTANCSLLAQVDPWTKYNKSGWF